MGIAVAFVVDSLKRIGSKESFILESEYIVRAECFN